MCAAAIRRHFGQFGTIVQGHVSMDKTTGRSKGFVFIKYSEPDVVQKVLGLQHELDGRTVCGCLGPFVCERSTAASSVQSPDDLGFDRQLSPSAGGRWMSNQSRRTSSRVPAVLRAAGRASGWERAAVARAAKASMRGGQA